MQEGRRRGRCVLTVMADLVKSSVHVYCPGISDEGSYQNQRHHSRHELDKHHFEESSVRCVKGMHKCISVHHCCA